MKTRNARSMVFLIIFIFSFSVVLDLFAGSNTPSRLGKRPSSIGNQPSSIGNQPSSMGNQQKQVPQAPSQSTTTRPVQSLQNTPSPVQTTVPANAQKYASLITMIAAVADSSEIPGKPEVRVKWAVTDGWLPDGGFNLYRTEGTNTIKLNQSPLGGVSGVTGKMKLSDGKDIDLRGLYSKASLPQGTDVSKIHIFEPSPPRSPSSAPLFEVRRNEIKKKFAPIAIMPSFLRNAGNVIAPGTRNKIKPGLATPPPAVAQKSPVDIAAAELSEVVLRATVNSDDGKRLGLAFSDKDIKEGSAYTYSLRTIDGGQESNDVASVTIKVTGSRKPPQPTGFQALQKDTQTAEIRWERLQADQENALGIVTYDITRFDKENPRGRHLNKLPLTVSEVKEKTATGDQFVEPVSFFSDKGVGVGKVTYRLTLTDAFGRTSDPVSIDFDMEDWFTPNSVSSPTAYCMDGKVTVTWEPSDESGVVYKIYRYDTEDKNSVSPLLLTQQPIPGVRVTVSDIRKFADKQPETFDYRLARGFSKLSALSKENQTAPTGSQTTKQQSSMKPVNLDFAKTKDLSSKQARSGLTGKKKILDEVLQDSNLSNIIFTNDLSFVDNNVQPDHYYIYMITAAYSRNNRETQPSQTNTVGVPDTMPPQTVDSSAKFVNMDEFGKNSISSVSSQMKSPVSDPTKAIANARKNSGLVTEKTNRYIGDQPLRTADGLVIPRPESTPFRKSVPYGGVVTLTWPVKGNHLSYLVYRANASTYAPASSSSPSQGGVKISPVTLQSGSNVSPTAVNSKSNDSSVPRMSGGKVGVIAPPKYRVTQLPKIPDEKYMFLGQVSTSKFDDYIPQSNAHYYSYRIIPVNRWGIKGEKSDLSIRVPAMLAPHTPMVTKVVPNVINVNNEMKGVIEIRFMPNVSDDEVRKYHIFRIADQPTGTIVTTGNIGMAGRSSNMQANMPSAKVLSAYHGIVQDNSITASIAQRQGKAAGKSKSAISQPPGNTSALSVASLFTRTPGDSVSKLHSISEAIKKVGQEVITQIHDPYMDSAEIVVNDSNVEPGRRYIYTVVAENSDSLTSYPSQPLDAIPLKIYADEPTNVTASSKNGVVSLAWKAGNDNRIGSIVERQTFDAGNTSSNFIQISGIIPTPEIDIPRHFEDHGVFKGKTYIYRIRGINAAGAISKEPKNAALSSTKSLIKILVQ